MGNHEIGVKLPCPTPSQNPRGRSEMKCPECGTEMLPSQMANGYVFCPNYHCKIYAIAKPFKEPFQGEKKKQGAK